VGGGSKMKIKKLSKKTEEQLKRRKKKIKMRNQERFIKKILEPRWAKINSLESIRF